MRERKRFHVEIDTCYTKLIPSKENISAESCFAADGLEITPAETLLNIYINDSTDLVTVVPVDALEQMCIHFSEQKTLLYTPLQRAIEKAVVYKKLTAVLHFTEHNLHIAVAEKGELKFAEVFPITSDNDLLYCLAEIDDSFGIAHKGHMLITGIGAEGRRKFLKKYFKHTSCE